MTTIQNFFRLYREQRQRGSLVHSLSEEGTPLHLSHGDGNNSMLRPYWKSSLFFEKVYSTYLSVMSFAETVSRICFTLYFRSDKLKVECILLFPASAMKSPCNQNKSVISVLQYGVIHFDTL